MADEEILEAPATEELTEAPAQEAPAEFPFVTLPPEITFTVRDVPPPSPAYVTPDDRLRIEARNSISGVTLEVHTRLLKPNGQIIQSLHTYTPTTNRALNTWTVPLAEGFLLTASVDAASSAKPGGCYVRVLLVRGSAPVVPIGQVLLAGYVVTGAGLNWPAPRYVGPSEGPGRLRLIGGTDPAAGAEISETVPTSARWRLTSFKATLVTSSTVVDRYVILQFSDGTNVVWESAPMNAQPASAGHEYVWAVGITAHISALTWLHEMPLPEPTWLAAGWKITTFTFGLQPGDNWAAPSYVIEEWIEP